MRAPNFWRRNGLVPRLLSPVAALYAQAARRRIARGRPQRLPVPLICVGNLVAGGAGKTPVALAVAAALQDGGVTPVFLTRGYGGREAGPLVVQADQQSAEAVGDEPLLLARQAVTVMARDRPAGAALAIESGAQVIVMDDGFQNPSLAKDLSLLVVDAAYGFGNGRVMPAGPLREDLSAGLGRASGVVVLRGAETAREVALPSGLPRLDAALRPARSDLAGRRVLAFAGIGRPEKFFASLETLGAVLVERLAFADHHRYRADELSRLRQRAEAAGCTLITTEKDMARLPAPERFGIDTLPVSVVWDDPAQLEALLRPIVEAAGG
ncbi:MAG: tetraacyldisaccharide 4'-kinase [Pseudomonadota bacterium]